MRICVAYDCLYPYTVGGAERWYRNVAERLAASGHDVTLITLRQWAADETPDVPGVSVVAVGPRMALYTRSGRRRILPPVLFGIGTLRHLLLRRPRYDVVHMASFPYFSVLAAALARPLGRFRLVVDWHEVWTRAYWDEYLGPFGRIGWTIQLVCARVSHRAFCFSRLHAGRLRDEGFSGELTVLEGQYEAHDHPPPQPPGEIRPLAVFAGRHIPEKRAPALVPAVAAARREWPELRAAIYGDGPDRAEVERRITATGLEEVVDTPGFAPGPELTEALAHAACMVLPSRREGYGRIVIEAASVGTPSVVVADDDNAATELVEDGVNGVISPSASPGDLASAIVRVRDGGAAMRASTADWFERNAKRLSLEASLDQVVATYASSSS
ncbi:MAG: glycosyltransferase family 4 protein [Thermoleophilaceae bacterium]